MGVAASLGLQLRSQLDLTLRNRASPLSWKPQPREQAGPSSRSTVFLFPFTKMVFVARVLSEDSILLGYTELKVGAGTSTET